MKKPSIFVICIPRKLSVDQFVLHPPIFISLIDHTFVSLPTKMLLRADDVWTYLFYLSRSTVMYLRTYRPLPGCADYVM